MTTLHQLIDTLSSLDHESDRRETADVDLDVPVLLNAVETGKLLSISRAKVLDLAARGEIPFIRVGGSVRIPRDRLIRWIDDNCSASGAPVARPPHWGRARVDD